MMSKDNKTVIPRAELSDIYNIDNKIQNAVRYNII